MSLLQLGHSVYFHPSLKQSIKELNIEMLRQYGIEVVEDISSLENIDVAVMSRPHNVHYKMPLVKKHLPNAKIIYDTEALWYRRYDLQLSITGKLPGWAYRYDELGMARAVDLCWVVNDIEKGILEQNGVKKVVKLAHALDVIKGGLSFEDRKDVLVVGGILEEDSSNEDALWWYLDNCWSDVEAVLGCTLNVTGKSHSRRLLEQKFPQVNLMGHVDDLIPLYQNHRAFVTTTRFATGIPWKIHEAMAHGMPCVISQLLADQLGVTDGKEALVVNNKEEGVEKTIKLYQDRDLWQSVREEGFKLVKRDCDPGRLQEDRGNHSLRIVRMMSASSIW
jgi:glycosyltransferase involved in cell wall biosynthesis